MGELHELTALEQGRAIAAGEVSAVELTEHYLERSARLGPEVGAFVTLTPELALAQARAADAAVSEGRPPHTTPLRGVVCPVKDLDAVAGVPTTMGSKAISLTFSEDSNVVSTLRSAGLVFTGKTNTPEFGLPCYTEPDHVPPARTPWDLTRSASGSSGGAAAAVAAGLAPFAQGSDGGGSVRLPAAVCGLVGIKSSRGRISSGPAGDNAGELAVFGPLARTVRDAAALLDVMSVPFVGDPFSAPPHEGTFLAAADRAPGRLRIGWYTTPVVGDTEPTSEVLQAIADTLSLLTDLGHSVEEIRAPIRHEAVPLFEILWCSLADSVPLPSEIEAGLTPLTRHLRQRAEALSAGELAGAVNTIRALARQAMVDTVKYDALLSPTAAAPPFPIGSMRNDDDPAADFSAQKQWSTYTAVYNVTGQPAINVPLNWTPEGLPIGVQFAGRSNDEATLITLAAQLEEARPWQHRHPVMW